MIKTILVIKKGPLNGPFCCLDFDGNTNFIGNASN